MHEQDKMYNKGYAQQTVQKPVGTSFGLGFHFKFKILFQLPDRAVQPRLP